MRNLKKLLAVIVSVCVLATFALPAFAAETTKSDAEICELIGVLRGDTSQGVTDEYLAKGTSRMQAALLYLRLIGKEDEALAYESEDNFDDADQTWPAAVPVLAYLKANPDLGWAGIGGNKFNPKGAASAQMIYKVCLEALGYKQDVDFKWDEVFSFAKEKGLSKIADVTELTNNDMAIALVEALQLKVKDGSKTLIEKLVADGAVTEAAAISAGLVKPAPDKLGIESLSADNLKEFILVFNKEVNKDTISTDNIKVKKSGATVAGYTVSLKDDNRTVVIKAGKDLSFENQTKYSVTVKNVKDTEGAKIDETTVDIEPFDAKLPEVNAVKVTGPKSLEIEFSEPIKKAGSPSVTLKTGTTTIGVNSATIGGYESNKISVDLYSTMSDGKTYTVSIKGFEDFAGYKMINYTTDIEYVTDKSEITAEIEKAEQTYVVIKFNKPVTFGTSPKEYFYHTFSAWKPQNVYTSEKFETANLATTNKAYSKVWVQFYDASTKNGYPLAEGGTKVVIRDTANDKKIKDNWGNEFLGATLIANVKADTTAPSVSEIKVESPVSGKSVIKVIFDENVKFSNDNIEVLNADGTKNSNIKLTITGSGKEYTVNLGTDLAGKSIFVTIKNVEDLALAPNKLVSYTATIDITDKTAPTVNKITYKIVANQEQALYVFFNEEMDDTALDKNNYYFQKTSPEEWKKIENEPTFYENNKTVRIELTDKEKGYILSSTYPNFVIMNVKDISGNTMLAKTVAFSDIQAVDHSSNVPEMITDTNDANRPKAIAVDKVEVTFNQYLTEIAQDAFVVNGKPVVGMTQSTNKDGNTVVTLTIDESVKLTHDATGVVGGGTPAITITPTASAKVANTFGVSVAPTTFTASLIDKIAPEIAKEAVPGTTTGETRYVIHTMDVNGNGKIDHIKVTFAEVMDYTYVAPTFFQVEGYDVKDAFATTGTPNSIINRGTVVAENSHDIYIRVAEKDSVDGDATPKVKIIGTLKDANGNELTANKDEWLKSVDKAGPVALTATESSDAKVITITFSEALDALTVVAASFARDSGAVPTVSYTAGSNTVTLTYEDALEENDEININGIKDVNGNAIAATTFTRGAGAAGSGAYTRS